VAKGFGMTEVALEGLTKSYGPKMHGQGQVIGPVSLEVRRGELVSLLGPSGCGKTTVLRMIAGFAKPASGRIRLRDEDVTASPPHLRRAALVFQSYALFPHLSVFENIAFGLRRRRMAKAELVPRVARMIAVMRLDGLADRLPQALSGGQQQRVALARALVIEPAVILLDEPFSSLDTKLRETTRMELRRLQQELGFTAILVTHDQGEALSISDRIAVMDKGLLVQIGSAQDIYYRPVSPFVAEFVGRSNRVPGGILRPESIRILPADAPEGQLATVSSCAFLGAASELTVRLHDGLMLTLAADGQAPLRHAPGAQIRVAWPQDAVITFGGPS
jgi:ABC-type Fe3+/spermidine/putrescine transport system ATPase subunit